MEHARMALILGGMFLLSPALFADSILIGGERYEDVIVREGGNRYYVQLPDSGRTISVAKDEISPGDVTISEGEARAALEAKWQANRPQIGETTRQLLAAASKPADEAADTANAPREMRLKGTASAGAAASQASTQTPWTPKVSRVQLSDVPLGAAFDALLRPLGLDYEVRGNIIYIAAPGQFSEATASQIEQRIYELHEDNGAALPKIVLRGVPVANASAQSAFGGGAGGLSSGFGGGLGGRTGGFGAGQAGFGGAGFGGGGFGGGGFGGGMGGGGGFGSSSGVTAISNISDLFTTIDDRIVGESPAVIGMVGL